MKAHLLALVAAVVASHAVAGDVVIEDARARATGDTWSFDVTLRHGDTGWDHYADAWSVNTPDGQEIGRRVLAHPHENEQPFTRSLSGVSVPNGVDEVVIRARDSVHGWSSATKRITLR